MDEPQILLTNDDGIDAPGLGALYESLTDIGDVTVVAPADDQSAVGRSRSDTVGLTDVEWGYVVDGTPVDCVIAGLRSLVPATDLVVAGCNQGANLGRAVLGRSGTVSAAVESTFLGVPAIAVSLYIPERLWADGDPDVDVEDYQSAVDAATFLADRSLEAGVFAEVDYLNVNAPLADQSSDELVVTRPSDIYRMNAVREHNTVSIHNEVWELMETDPELDHEGTDRRTVMAGDISVSGLSGTHTVSDGSALSELISEY